MNSKNDNPILNLTNLKKNYHDIDGETCAISDISFNVYP